MCGHGRWRGQAESGTEEEKGEGGSVFPKRVHQGSSGADEMRGELHHSLSVPELTSKACKHLFCPPHRHASSHTCSPSDTPSGSLPTSRTNTPQPASQSKSAMSRLITTKQPVASSSTTAPHASVTPKPTPAPASPAVPISAQLDARAAAAAAAMRRAGQDAKAPFVKSKTDK